MRRNLLPARAAAAAAGQLAAAAAPAPTENAKRAAAIQKLIDHGASFLLPARGRCDAWLNERHYSAGGQCEKTHGLRRMASLKFCPHHLAQLLRRGVLDLGAGVVLEGPK